MHQSYEDLFFDNVIEEVLQSFACSTFSKTISNLTVTLKIREPYHIFIINEPESWIDSYNEIVLFQLYRMKKETFQALLQVILANDQYCLLNKKYRGGNYPVQPEKSILIFL